jgi:phytoene/squalene synthetase
MRASLAATGITAAHCHDVLRAFRQDAVKLRYRDWDDLMEYCRYSAAPVGRQLLDLPPDARHLESIGRRGRHVNVRWLLERNVERRGRVASGVALLVRKRVPRDLE